MTLLYSLCELSNVLNLYSARDSLLYSVVAADYNDSPLMGYVLSLYALYSAFLQEMLLKN